jgi:hypothetical protein
VYAAGGAGTIKPQITILMILQNENDDCTSSMVCKDGMKALIDVSATITTSTATADTAKG